MRALVRATANTAWCEWSRAVGHGAIGFRLYCQRTLRYQLTGTLPNVATLSALVEHVHAPSAKSLLTLRSGPQFGVLLYFFDTDTPGERVVAMLKGAKNFPLNSSCKQKDLLGSRFSQKKKAKKKNYIYDRGPDGDNEARY